MVLSLMLIFTGCGGGGDGGGNPPPQTSSLAPASAAGRTVDLQVEGSPPETVQFATSGNQFIRVNPGNGEVLATGTFNYTGEGSGGQLVLVENSGQNTTYQMQFQTTSSGTFTFMANSGQSGGGTFANFVPHAESPNPPPSGGGNGNGDEQAGPETSLDGRVMSLRRATGQLHTYTFTASRFIDSDPPEEGRGTYNYWREGNTASLILEYDESVGPVNLAGDRHEITLVFEDESRGSYDSVYHTWDGTLLQQLGRFEFIQ